MNEFKKILKEIQEIKTLIFFNTINAEIKLNSNIPNENETIRFGNTPELLLHVELIDYNKVELSHNLCESLENSIWENLGKEIEERGFEFGLNELKDKIFEECNIIFPNLKIAEISLAIKGLFLFNLLLKYILIYGKLPRAVWNHDDPEFDKWKDYLNIKPMTAAILDGLLYEIDTIPNAVNYLIQLMSIPDIEEKEFSKVHSKIFDEKMINFYMTDKGLSRIESEYESALAKYSVGRLLMINKPKM